MASSQAAQYDPSNVNVVVVGPVVIPKVHGFAPGTFVAALRDRPRFSKIVGVDGEVARRRSRDRTGAITMVLEAASQSNILLQALHTLDDATQSGIATVFIRDRNALIDLVIGTQCWVVGPPNYSKGMQAGTVQWRFEAARLEVLHGALRQV